jgi:pimeloyl-ACP methyl ester carboxylesterase
MLATARFMRQFLLPTRAGVIEEETAYRRGGESLPATLYRPRHIDRPLPGWMTLHGLTYHGREHVSLKRLARAIAASGSVVFVPDIPEWRALRVAPAAAVETIKSAVLELDALRMTASGRIGVIGFSFGATQALIAATDPVLRGHLAGMVSWGGYADIETVTRFMFVGEHELDGTSFRTDPDPYGRWILAGNYLGLLDEFAGDPTLADALLGLAHEAARLRIRSWNPALDPVKLRARDSLAPDQRQVFDLLAPAAGATPGADDRARLRDLARRLVEAGVAREPLLDARPYLLDVPVPVFLAHGRNDRLIPWTEMIRLRRALAPGRVASSGITSLFTHSMGERRLPTPAAAVEAARFIRLMHRMLRLI